MPAYEPDNIIAKILNRELPAYTVYEDEHTLAFLDIFPQAPGHMLVIPRAPSRNLLDADPAIFAPLGQTVQKMARAAMAAFSASGVRIQQFNEAAAGQTIFHLHIHVIPVTGEDNISPHGQSARAEPETLRTQAEALRRAITTLQSGKS